MINNRPGTDPRILFRLPISAHKISSNFSNARLASLLSSAVCCLILLLLMIGSISAQTSTSTDGYTPQAMQPGSSYNLYNGHLGYSVPVVNIGGRGGTEWPLPFRISKLPWRVRTHVLPDPTPSQPDRIRYVFYPRSDWWNEALEGVEPRPFTPGGRMLGRYVGNVVETCAQPVQNTQIYQFTNTHLTFTMPDGTEIEFRSQLNQGQPLGHSCSYPTTYDRGKVFSAIDGSGATFISDSLIYDQTFMTDGEGGAAPEEVFYSLSGYVLLKDGTRFRIKNSRTEWIRDRNGNLIKFYYSSEYENKPYKIVDSLNREVLFFYDSNGLNRVRYFGFGNQPRDILISYDNLSNLLRSGQSIQNECQLFPQLDCPVNPQSYNPPRKVGAITLPDGRSYQFRYNSYGELAQVTLPTGAVIQYDYEGGELNGTASGVVGDYLLTRTRSPYEAAPEVGIFRRLVEQRLYPDGVNLESTTTYGKNNSTWLEQGGWVCNLEVVNHSGDRNGPVLSRSKQYFNGDPIYSMLRSHNPVGDPDPLEGKEIKTEIIDPSGSTVLKRVESQWGPAPWPTRSQMTELKTTLLDVSPNLISKQSFAYDTYNNQTDVWEYDFGSGQVGPLVRHSHMDYLTTNNGVAYDTVNPNTTSPDINATVHIRGLPLRKWVSSDIAGNNKFALTEYEYDNYTSGGYSAPLVPRTDIVGLCLALDSNGNCTTPSTPSYTTRGNVTSVKSYSDAATPTGPLTGAVQYDVAGNLVKMLGGRSISSNQFYGATIDYTDRFGSPDEEALSNTPPQEIGSLKTYAFPTSVTDLLGRTVYSQYDYRLGVAVNNQDINGVVSASIFDNVLDRPKQRIFAINISQYKAQVTYNYDDTERIVTVTSDLNSYGDNVLKSQTLYDRLGRMIESRTYENATDFIATRSVPFLMVMDPETSVLCPGSKSSNSFRPYRGEQPVWTTTLTNSQERSSKVIGPDGAIAKTVYRGAQTLSIGPSGKKRLGKTDALGRLTDVWEIKTADPETENISFPNYPNLSGYRTSYVYDILGNLRQVSQGTQRRYFMYDSLSRLIRMKNVEQDVNTNLPPLTDPITNNSGWSQAFTYDEDSNPKTSTTARNITITNTYDIFGRVTNVDYSDSTPDVTYIYDAAPAGEPTVPYSIGQLVQVTNGVTTTKFTEYDQIGQLKSSQVTTEGLSSCKADGTPCTFTYNYNFAGQLVSETYPSGREVRNSFDSLGRLASVSSKTGTTQTPRIYANGFSYDKLDEARMRLGNGLWENVKFNERFQIKEISLGTSASQANRLKLEYNYGTTDNNGNIKSQTITVPTIGNVNGFTTTQFYEYDDLNRLKLAYEKPQGQQLPDWQQSFRYDRWGNRTVITQENKIGEEPVTTASIVGPNPAIDIAKNRIVPKPNTNEQYLFDASGNTIRDAEGNTFTYDADNHQKTFTKTGTTGPTATYFYDGDGRRVKKVVKIQPQSGQPYDETTHFVYDAGGTLVEEYTVNAPVITNPQTVYMTTDKLGSPRVNTGAKGEVIARHDYLPFGEEIIGLGQRNANQGYGMPDNVRQKFTGYEKDEETKLDFAQARYYGDGLGRFTSVDPLISSASLTNPQTFNRYSYVGNNPINDTDPSGLCPKGGCGNHVGPVYVDSTGKQFWDRPRDGYTQYTGGSVLIDDPESGFSYLVTANGWTEIQPLPTAADTSGQNFDLNPVPVSGPTFGDHAKSALLTVIENNGASLTNDAGITTPYRKHTLVGQAIGNTVTIIQSAAEIAIGLTTTVGGGAATIVTAPACATGIGCAVPATTATITTTGLVVATHGGGVFINTIYNMAYNQEDIARSKARNPPDPDEPNKWKSPEEWAEIDIKNIQNEVRKETMTQGFESGRHGEYAQEMVRRLEALIAKAKKEGRLAKYTNKLESTVRTFKKRADSDHKGGISGRGR